MTLEQDHATLCTLIAMETYFALLGLEISKGKWLSDSVTLYSHMVVM
jgi:hypothetical protein